MKPTTRTRILKALEGGPLYEGALGLVLGWPSNMRRVLYQLKDERRIERVPDEPMSWRLRS